MKTWLFSGLFILAVVIGAVLYKNLGGHSIPSGGREVDWRLLGELDYITGKSTAEVQALNGQRIKVPGFMVPLEDDQRKVTEFLLVPTPQACIHVPPPPPNQMIYVKMKNPIEAMDGPIWVYGTMNLVTKNSKYGDASYEVLGEAVEVYK